MEALRKQLQAAHEVQTALEADVEEEKVKAAAAARAHTAAAAVAAAAAASREGELRQRAERAEEARRTLEASRAAK